MLMSIKHDGIVAFVDLFEDHDYFYLVSLPSMVHSSADSLQVMEHHGTPWAEQREVRNGAKSSPGVCVLDSPTKVQSGHVNGSPASLPLPRPAPAIRRSSCDLFECIEQRSKLSENEARYVFAQVVSTCYFLHCHNIYHMDLKDENLVIDNKLKVRNDLAATCLAIVSRIYPQVKLIDFGSAVQCAPNRIFSRFYGTVAYASPEILQSLPYHAPSSEMWSLGILFSILLTGESIYRDPEAVLSNNYNHEAFASLSPDCQHILHLCLQYDSSQRASIAELRAHPYLSPTIRQLERQHRRK
jgi:serine/threonine protein kinase